jgi:predicted ArsR family transcriptional regulator
MIAPDPPSPPTELDLLADALGDPTRRAVFNYVADTSDPVTAGDVGITFGIHRTVARAHLEKLVDSGLLSAEFRHRPEGGRPPKVYRRSDRRIDLQMPARQYELLAELLVSVLERFGEAAELIATEVGFEFGRQWADTGRGGSPQECLAPLTEAGAEISTAEPDGELLITRRNCLFREVAARRPRLVCILDRAITDGMLSHADRPLKLRDWTRCGDQEAACIHTYQTISDRVTEDAQ